VALVLAKSTRACLLGESRTRWRPGLFFLGVDGALQICQTVEVARLNVAIFSKVQPE